MPRLPDRPPGTEEAGQKASDAMKKAVRDEQKAYALATLREVLKPGTRIYTILRHRSRSGMMRHVSLLLSMGDDIRDITSRVATVLDDKMAEDGGIKVLGCGFDSGFHLVYNLGRVLYPDGVPCSGPGCCSNEHTNGDRDYSPHTHVDGGYSFRHCWL